MNKSQLIGFDKKNHHFYPTSDISISIADLDFPLSVSLQITRECNLKCVYCSELRYEMKNNGNSLENIMEIVSRLKNIKRIIVTGGEPLMREDLPDILKYIRSMQFETVALATNGVLLQPSVSKMIKGLVDYVDVTVDGPRHIHNEIRGEYDEVLSGIKNLKSAGIPFSLVTVLFKQNAGSILYICQLADVLEATQLKIVTPIDKGRGKSIRSELLSSADLSSIFQKVKSEKHKNGWNTRIVFTDWDRVGEGHAILLHPNGDVVASPVPSQTDCVNTIGNILDDDLKTIWARYPYKQNHLSKYLDKTTYVC